MLRDKAVFQWIFKGKGPASSRHRCQGSGATNRGDVLEKLLGNRALGARMTTDSGGEARRQKAAPRRGRRPHRPRSEAGSSQALRRRPTPPPSPPAAPHPTCSASRWLLFSVSFSPSSSCSLAICKLRGRSWVFTPRLQPSSLSQQKLPESGARHRLRGGQQGRLVGTNESSGTVRHVTSAPYNREREESQRPVASPFGRSV